MSPDYRVQTTSPKNITLTLKVITSCVLLDMFLHLYQNIFCLDVNTKNRGPARDERTIPSLYSSHQKVKSTHAAYTLTLTQQLHISLQ